jgi:hypothetical protein
MYALVGCVDCSALWIVADRPERTNCPRCGRSHQLRSLKAFVETDDKAHAREVRASMLAARQDEDEAFARLDHVEEMEMQLDEAGVDDDTYLAASGLDPDAVAAAGEAVTDSERPTGSRRDIILMAVEDLSSPTEEAIVSYAGERGVSASFVRTALDKLRRGGELTRSGELYRRL